MKPKEAVDALASAKIVDSGSTVSMTNVAPTIYPWVKVEFQGKVIKLSGAHSIKTVMKKVRTTVCPGASVRNRDVKNALALFADALQFERDKVVARDTPTLSARHGVAVLTKSKRLVAEKRREAVKQLRLLLKGPLADASEDEIAEVWREARAEEVLGE